MAEWVAWTIGIVSFVCYFIGGVATATYYVNNTTDPDDESIMVGVLWPLVVLSYIGIWIGHLVGGKR